jgi:nitrogenase cofactor biosynthesis protein NifB
MDKAARSANLLKSLRHPCYNGNCAAAGGGRNTRIHLPVAPRCNIQCNYCVRKYECVNESRPGVTARVLSPKEALERFLAAREKLGRLDVAAVAGPGDALANFDEVRETFSLIRAADAGVIFCLSTNGLLLPHYAGELAALGVSHVTVTVNAAEPETARRVYRFVHYEGQSYQGAEGAALLLGNQFEGIALLRERGVVVKVNIVMLKDLNDREIPAIVEKARDAGAELANIMQLIPVKGSLFEHLPLVSNAEIMETRKNCESILPQMYHCRQCRADAVGTLDDDLSYQFSGGARLTEERGAGEEAGSGGEPARTLRIAAASKSGMIADQHFGHAEAFYVYEYRNGRAEFVEKRDVSQYCRGQDGCGIAAADMSRLRHEETLEAIIAALSDCDGVIAMRIGEAPLRKLEARGIRFFMTYNYVGDAVKEFAENIIGEKREREAVNA